jgi:hypothetical protein
MKEQLNPEAVTTREAFAEFVEGLKADLASNPEQWENNTLEGFLSAMSRYAEDVPGYLRNTQSQINKDAPSWQLFATILSGAIVYE